MNLVLFEDALEHLTRIHRVIRMDKGNALLVGVGGSGKASCKNNKTIADIYRFYFHFLFSDTFSSICSWL